VANVNRQEDASVNGLDTANRRRFPNKGNPIFMKQLLAALVVTALSAVAFAQGGTTPASPSAPQASASASAPAKSGTTKKAKKKKAKPASSANASGSSPK